ncbi:hypothetical protein BDV19DRAFT_363108 [Aspergillus venezuelensis]
MYMCVVLCGMSVLAALCSYFSRIQIASHNGIIDGPALGLTDRLEVPPSTGNLGYPQHSRRLYAVAGFRGA